MERDTREYRCINCMGCSLRVTIRSYDDPDLDDDVVFEALHEEDDDHGAAIARNVVLSIEDALSLARFLNGDD